jgi:hypothetical protein
VPPSRLPPAVTDLARLNDPFRDLAQQLVDAVAAYVPPGVDVVGLPLVVNETWRPLVRQRAFYNSGNSKLTVGPHCFGLAMDMVLDPRDARWPKFGDRPFRAIDGGGAPWDTGYDADARGVATLARPSILDVWNTYGDLAKGLGLEWGGSWIDGRYAGYPLGWDVAHVQMPGWEQIAKDRGYQPA